MKLITKSQRERMLANAIRKEEDCQFDPEPVVKLFTPDANATWLLTELDPDDPDLAFGLCDLGLGSPELGSIRISEIAAVRGKFGLAAERDLYFTPDKTLSAYAEQARHDGFVRA